MVQTPKDLNEYITTVKKLKPSAEVKFKSVSDDGVIEETVASREYIAKHAGKEMEAASKVPGLSERLKKNLDQTNAAIAEANAEVDELEEEQLGESQVVFKGADDKSDDSPLTHVPNVQHQQPTTENMSETALLIQLVSTLIDKIDQMQNFNPVIHVPAPVIHVTLPETKRTATKVVERDENNWIKSVTEHIEETPQGEPLIEVMDAPAPKKRRKVKKDNK